MATTAEKTLIRLGDRDYELGSQAHLDAIETNHKTDVATLKAQVETLSGKLDSAEKAVEIAKREKTEVEAKSATDEKERAKDLTARVKARSRFLMRALRLFGEDDGEEEVDEEKKMDALCEMSEREIQLKAIAKVDPDFKADGKSDDFVAGKFEGAVKYLDNSRGVDGVARVLIGAGGAGGNDRLDSNDSGRGEHPVAKARRENAERMRKLAEPASAREGGAR